MLAIEFSDTFRTVLLGKIFHSCGIGTFSTLEVAGSILCLLITVDSTLYRSRFSTILCIKRAPVVASSKRFTV